MKTRLYILKSLARQKELADKAAAEWKDLTLKIGVEKLRLQGRLERIIRIDRHISGPHDPLGRTSRVTVSYIEDDYDRCELLKDVVWMLAAQMKIPDEMRDKEMKMLDAEFAAHERERFMMQADRRPRAVIGDDGHISPFATRPNR